MKRAPPWSMRYLGGKSRESMRIAAVVRDVAALFGYAEVEDRFAGGLALTVAMNAVGLKVRAIEDGAPCMVTLYRAIRDGWEPPPRISPPTYRAIAANPDPADPMTAFALIGCSFGAKWAAGLASPDLRWPGETSRYTPARVRAALLMCRPLLCELEIREGDCLGPCPGAVLVADPPYQSGEGYPYAPPCDHRAVWGALSTRAGEGPVLACESEEPPAGEWRRVWAKRTAQNQLRSRGAHEFLFAAPPLAVALAELRGLPPPR